ncbi:MAG: stage II sporulation protein D [Eubacteriaceae bacterium]|nr:stage II sporulation protein D [Eubacteriaceae bacterium]
MRKKLGLYVFIILLIFIIIPALIVKCFQHTDTENEDNSEGTTIKILDVQHNKALEMEFEDYIKCVVAGEMPATFEEEALKAQAVAARTFTIRRMQGTTSAHPQYDICTDYKCCQAFISKEDRLKAWQDSGVSAADSLLRWQKIEKAVDDTKGKVLVYSGELISALYFSASGGKTENSEDYFVSAYPYLRSVDSPYEGTTYKNIETTITLKDFLTILKTKYPDFKIDQSKVAQNIKINSYTTGGKVKEIVIGNKNLSGREVRELFDLRSSGFTIKLSGSNITFTTNGNGHGVGMSQYGANGYAKNGYTFDEILLHYYLGAEIVDYSTLK